MKTLIKVTRSTGALLFGMSLLLPTPGRAASQVTIETTSPVMFRGGTITLTSTVLGDPADSYQWQLNANDLAWATNETLILTNAQYDARGEYGLVISNQYGVVSSSAIQISVVDVAVWGSNNYGQTNVPPDLTNVITVAGTAGSGLALIRDGTVRSWGGLVSPADLTNVTAIAAGYGHALALKQDRTIAVWGNNTYGQLNVPKGLTNIIAVAAGYQHSLALLEGGTVLSWGDNTGQQTNVPPSLTNAIGIAAGKYHSLALRSDGTVVAWGSNAYGQANVPAGLSNVIALAGGDYLSIALQGDGHVQAWGQNGTAQTSVPSDLSNVVAVAAGMTHNLALKDDGTLVAWGIPSELPPGLSQVVNVACAANHSLAVVGNGAPIVVTPFIQQTVLGGGVVGLRVAASGAWPLSYQWRLNGVDVAGATGAMLLITNAEPSQMGLYSVVVSNAFGSTESPSSFLTVMPLQISLQPTNRLALLGHSASFSVAARGNQPVTYQWQFNEADIPGETNNVLTLPSVQVRHAGTYRVKVVNPFDAIYSAAATLSVVPIAAWGLGTVGQTNVPATADSVLAIAAGTYHSLALKSDGTVVGWGTNGQGQLNAPATLTNAIAISAGAYHNLALRNDGTVAAWGNNPYGETNVPANLNGVVAIAAGGFHSMVLRDDGTVLVWGRNNYGQTNVPGDLGDVVAIAAGGWHCLALRSDGSVRAWGQNLYHQTNVPVSITNAIAIAASQSCSLALRSGGTVVSWGDDPFIRPPTSLSNVVSIAAGSAHILALKSNGKIVIWGGGMYGELTVPADLTNVVAVAAGYALSLALVGDAPPIVNAMLDSPEWSNGHFRLSTASQSGRVYRLECADSVDASTWTALPLVAGNGGRLILTDTNAYSPQRVYRVRRW